MNTVALHATKNNFHRSGILFNVLSRYVPNIHSISPNFATTIDAIDTVANNLVKNHLDNKTNSVPILKYCVEKNVDQNDVDKLHSLSSDQINTLVMEILRTNNHKKMEQIFKKASSKNLIGKHVIYKLFQAYSFSGNLNIVLLLQDYCLRMYPKSYLRNGEYLHYVARAQCMKGNADQGLMLLRDCYEKYDNLRGLYRFILRDLITDSVQHRSEASLVIFKKHIMYLSDTWSEHYPVVCFWHICWASTWFSDQMIANELLETCEPLRNIIQERAPALCILILRNEFNEDAVMRLLQSLLKYDMMLEYAKVLQILFGYKLKNRDIRGCREIIHNCEALDITLPSDQQGRFIKLVINKNTLQTTITPSTNNFKLKF